MHKSRSTREHPRRRRREYGKGNRVISAKGWRAQRAGRWRQAKPIAGMNMRGQRPSGRAVARQKGLQQRKQNEGPCGVRGS